MLLPLRTVGLIGALGAGLALAVAWAGEFWGGLVPCALCLLERWPYRIAIGLGLLAMVLPARIGRWMLAGFGLAMLAAAGLAVVHVGVEQSWWPSPLPECAAPRLGGGTLAERLARMPATPAKPCDDPAWLIPAVPVSMAAMNLVYALALAAFVAICLARQEVRPA